MKRKARLRLLAGVAAAAAVLVGGQVAVAATTITQAEVAAVESPVSGKALVVNDVHTDALDIRYDNGALRLQSRVGTSCCYTHHQPDELVFQVVDEPDLTRIEFPDDPDVIEAYGFLGAPGDLFWMAPEVQIDGVIWPGFSTEAINPGVFVNDVVNIELLDVSGPGRFEMFTSGTHGPTRMLSSTDPAIRTYSQTVNSHNHMSWAFTALGRYELTMRVSGTLAGGGAIQSEPVTYTWFVGGSTSADVVAAATTMALTITPIHPGTGDEITFATSVTPANARGWVEIRDGETVLGYAEVIDGAASLSSTGLSAGEHAITARFVPLHDNVFAPSVSPAQALVVSPQGGGSPSPSASGSASASPSASTSASPSPSPSMSVSASASPSVSAGASPSVQPSTSVQPSVQPSRTKSPAAPTPSPSLNCVTTTTYVPILDVGHADYATRIVDGRLESRIKDGTVAGRVTWRDPAEVVLHLKPAGKDTLPAGFDFIGSSGAAVWQIPQTQKTGVLWLGWNTEAIAANQLSGSVSWSLTGVGGPGRMAVYTSSSFGSPTVIFASADGLPDNYSVSAGTHAHGNWAFTQEGIYRLTFTQRATLAGGAAVSDTKTMTIAVGSADPRSAAARTTRTGEGCGGAGGGAGGNLARTGTSVIWIVTGGIALLGTGAVLMLATRRRTKQAVSDGAL